MTKIKDMSQVDAQAEVAFRLSRIAKDFRKIKKIEAEHGRIYASASITMPNGNTLTVDTDPSAWVSSQNC